MMRSRAIKFTATLYIAEESRPVVAVQRVAPPNHMSAPAESRILTLEDLDTDDV